LSCAIMLRLMIPLWRSVQKNNFKKIGDLLSFLELTDEQKLEIDVAPEFPLNLPYRLAQKIQKRTLQDPVFRQFVPLKEEKSVKAGFSCDPVDDLHFRKDDSKLLQKYESRALIVTTSACAMNCRFCFRKNFPYETERKDYHEELTWLRNNPSVKEVILSGGDPLSLSDAALQALFNEIDTIEHIERIRFHTRFPVGIPERIDEAFLTLLKNCKKQIWFVLHSNCLQEFDEDIWAALKAVQKCGIPVLNQTVLLKGVNDSTDELKVFFEALVDHGVQPYYLHQLDRVAGAHHFEVEERDGLKIVGELQKALSGYAVPKYVREIAGQPCKTELR
jgi:L-lysine 2,3-aminomutase